MTMPDERYRAVMWAKRFLTDIAHNTKDYPRVPKKVRGEAHSILRHFPNEWDLDSAARRAPDVFQEKMDDLHKFLLKGKENENRTEL